MIKMEGIAEFNKVLDQIPVEIQKRGHVAAARKAAKPIRDGAKNILKRNRKGTDRGFSKLELLATQVKIETMKQTVMVKIGKRAIEIPLELKDRTGFSSFGYARLVSQGRQWTGKTSATRRRHFTGYTEGIGDFIEESFDRNFSIANEIYKRERVRSIKRVFDKTVKKYGRR